MFYFHLIQIDSSGAGSITSSGNFMSSGELIITGISLLVGFILFIQNKALHKNSKKFDFFFTKRTEAFSSMYEVINKLKNYCAGREAEIIGNEYAPFYEETNAALQHRAAIAEACSKHGIYLSQESRRLIEDLVDAMSGLCSLEATFAMNENLDLQDGSLYHRYHEKSDSILIALHEELGLPIK